ncbi:MAG: alpha/beta fold hydrolase [Isosphaeraceae bacterium]
MNAPTTTHPPTANDSGEPTARLPCPAPADFRAAVADYDARCQVATWNGPRHRMTYRVLGDGPPLLMVPGIASTYRGYCLTLNLLSERFKTVIHDYPGEHPGDGASLGKISHDDLVDDVFGLIDHLNLGRVFLVGLSFGTTIVLKSLAREPRRFPKAAIQGAFARRRFTPAERLALSLGRHVPGTTSRLPFREPILAYNNRQHFPEIIDDRWRFYVEQNGLTPIAPLAHRLGLVARLDLRPILPTIPTEVLALQGNEDRIVGRSHFDEVCAGLPRATGVIMPMVGHQPHYTHPEGLARAIGDWFLPCAPGGCPSEQGASTPP